MRFNVRRFLASIFSAGLLFATACGGSDGTAPPPAPPPNPPAPPPPPPTPPGPAPRTLIAGMTLPAAGGTLRYTNAADPLNGLSLVVPAGAYPAPGQWTITADSGVSVPLPAGFSQVGPVLVVNSGRDYADSVMTLTVPMRLVDDDAVAPFFFDPATAALEAIPLVDRTDTSATLATRHFSATALAVPGNAAIRSGTTASAASGFGVVQIVWIKASKTSLVGTFTSSFRPGADDWEFANYGDYISPRGDCEGMSVTAMYYHYFVKAGGQPQLFHRYDASVPNQWDNVQGIRFAGSVQGDYEAQLAAGGDQINALIAQAVARGAKLENLTSTWILLTLKLNSRPVLMGLRGSVGGHAVVAYAATFNGTRADVSFADPNFPGSARTMVFQSGVLTPVTLQLNANASAGTFDKAYAIGVSGELPIAKISSRWAEFGQQKAGADRYPPTWRFEVYDYLTATWTTLPDVLKTTDAKLEMRMICPSCPEKTVGGATDEHRTELWDAGGTRVLTNTGIYQNHPGTANYLLIALANSPWDKGQFGFVDAKPFRVDYQPFSVGIKETTLPTDTDGHFFASAGSLAAPGSKYTWTISDGSAPIVVQGDSTLVHQFTRLGTYDVSVTLTDPTGKIIAKDQLSVQTCPNFTVALSPDPLLGVLGVPVSMTVTYVGKLPSGGLPPHMTFEWAIFDSGSYDFTTTTSGPTLAHSFPAPGDYEVYVYLHDTDDPSGVPFVVGGPFPVRIGGARPVWRFTSFARTGGSGPAPDPLFDDAGPFRAVITRIEAAPDHGLVFLLDQSYTGTPVNDFQNWFPLVWVQVGTDAVNSQLGVISSGHLTSAGFEVAGNCTPAFAAVASECAITTMSNTGGLMSGSLTGAMVGTSGGAPPFPSVIFTLNAVKNGGVMSGTLQLTDKLHGNTGPPTGTRIDIWTFSAKLVP